MAFFRKLFPGGGKPKKKEYPNIIQGVDPLECWVKIGELGDGAFGKVFKTEHRDSGKLAAMKRVPIQDDTELDDFMVEIDVLAECKNTNIVGLHEAYYYDSALWIYIEFCAGGAMDDIIVELDHGLSEPQIACISRQMFEGVAFLHSRSCIHRDLKAGNILLCPDGSIRLADFGVSAKDSSKGKKHDTFIGTPYWMAPEVVVCETIKDEPYDTSADIWSAGITLIELADMNPPYHEMSPMRVLQKVVKKDPPILAVPSRWSANFNSIISKCLNKMPSARPTAEQLLEHPFIATITDHKPLRFLYQEVKSEVEETMEELDEDADLTVDPEHSEAILSATPTLPDPSTVPETVVHEPSPPAEGETHSPEEGAHSQTPLDVGPEPVVVVSDDAISKHPEEPPKVPPSQTTDERRGSDEETRQEDQTSVSSEVSSTPGSDNQHARERLGVTKEVKYATLSRVRKFKVGNQVMQSTTKKIVDVAANRTLRDNKKYQQMRKQDFRELKQLQREEMKEATEYYNKIKLDREVLERKCETELQEHDKRYETELETLKKRQKKESDRLEGYHIQHYKLKARSIKTLQSKDLKRFKDNLKEEEKLAVKRVEVSSSKGERKAAVSQMKLQLQEKRAEKEMAFSNKQVTDHESQIRQIMKEQMEERKRLELSFLDARHDVTRNYSSMKWEMEQRHKQEYHQLLKHQLREAFHMQRHQMQVRHQMEVQLQGRRDQFQLEELRQNQLLEKRQLPKRLKLEHKQKVAEARKALRNKKADKETLRKLDEEYVQKCQMETDLMNEKHEKDMETLKLELDTNMRELQEIQNEKKMMLTQQETNKMKDRDEQHTQDLREWRADIAKRKQKLEDGFQASRTESEDFFSQERPLPRQLRPSSSFSDRSSRNLSMSSLDSTQSLPIFSAGAGAGASRPALNPLDEVVLGTPVLSHSSPNKKSSAQNGKST